MILDLGCGGNLHEGSIGVDIVGRPHTAADIVCNLGFEPIPVENDMVDKIIIEHFIEHIPFAVWGQSPEYFTDDEGNVAVRIAWRRYLPVVYLWNEMYRVLKDRGVVQVKVPIVTNGNIKVSQQMFQDITHVSFWVPETVRYLSGDFYGFHEVYGHTSRFMLKWISVNDWWMDFELVAVKSLPQDHPYLLEYEGY